MSFLTRLPLGLFAVLVLRGPLAALGVLVGVDLGSQYFKAAIVSPGKPFDIVHNQHSKRKTPTVVSFHEKVRAFGDDAIPSAGRNLPKTPMFFTHQLGLNLSQSSGDQHWLPKMFFPYNLGLNSSGSRQFKFGEDDGVTVEEATAHILSFIKRLAELAADGLPVTEGVLTVSPQATQLQRRALLAAAEIARLPGAQLLHETSAAALQRAPDLMLEGTNGTANSSTVLYYNMGARHVEVCIVVYTGATHMSRPTVAMDVLGCGTSANFGGHHVDMLLAEEMRNAFGTKKPKLAKGLETAVRSLKKLEKEANSLKHVLSANKEATFRVEALYEDTDFSQQFSREKLESLCAPLFEEATKPIEEALRIANVSLEDVDTVEMIGGAWRMPKVQSLLSEYIQRHRSKDSPVLNLSQHLNGEEAMATGAAFFGANSSAQFRTKKIFFTDVMPHSYSLLLSPLNASQLNASEADWARAVDLFPAYSKLRAKKTVKLHVGFDLSMTLVENGNHVTSWELKGIHEAVTTTYATLDSPLISLKLELDASGVVRLGSAQAVFDEPYTYTVVVTPPPVIANTSSNNTEGDSNSSTAADGEGTEAKAKDEGEAAKAPETQADAAEAPAAEAPATEAAAAEANASEANASQANNTVTKTKIRKKKVPLGVLEHFEGISPRPLSADEIAWARSRLDDQDAADAEVQRTLTAKNTLEAFVYESREKVTSDEWCLQVSTEEEREAIVSMLTATEDWLYEDEATNGNATTFEDKMDGLNEKVGPIRMRAFELEQRPSLPEIVVAVSDYVNSTLTYVKTNMTWVAAKEIEGVVNLTVSFEDWYANVTKQQEQLKLTEMPAYTTRDVKVRLLKMRTEAERLTKIIKIDPMPYKSDYGGGYGGYGGGGYGGYGGYDDAKMRDFYKHMYENQSGNGSNFSGFGGGNFSNFSGWNDSEYMRSYYEHMAREYQNSNFSRDEAKDNETHSESPAPQGGDAPAPANDGPAPASEEPKADHKEL